MRLEFRYCIFFSLVGLLIFQSYVLYRFDEPYPAIVAPSFPAGQHHDFFIKPLILFSFSDGSVQALSQGELLDQFPYSHHGALMRFFSPISDTTDSTTRKLYKVFPGYRKGRREIRKNLPDAWVWFQIQSRRLFQRIDLTSVRVEWQKFSTSDHRMIETTGVYEVSREIAQ